MTRLKKTPRSSAKAKASRKTVPARVDSKRDLADLQRAVWGIVSTPLTAANRMRPRAKDGRKMTKAVGEIIKPNDRLTSFERLEIYNRMYWFRVLDSLYEDCPGLRAVLGDQKFIKMAEAYLVKYPSRSHTLRNLPSRLAQFIHEEPKWTRPHTKLCHDLARFEWAQVEVYDGATLPLFTPDQLVGANVEKLKLALQPYLQLLEVGYPVDDFLIHIKKREALLRGDTSNAPTGIHVARKQSVKLPKAQRCHVAVHRHGGKIYFKRLDSAAGKILLAIRAGKPLGAALAAGLPKGKQAASEDLALQVQGWFQTWMQLGWFCRRE